MIKLSNIYHSFNDKTVFNGYSLHVAAGEKILLFSQSGTGKTTLMKMIMGFVIPDKGKIIVDNIELSASTVKEVRKKISYVSQGVDYEKVTILDLVNEISSLTSDFDRDVFEHYANLFDVCKYKKEANLLSGGEKQRLGLSIGLALHRPVLLLDEITSGLDEELKIKVRNAVLDTDRTAVIISHDSVWKEDERLRKETFNNGRS